MACAKREYAFFVCLGGLLSASVGFSISLFATILSFFISGPQQPIIQIPDAAVKASTPSLPSPSKDARDDEKPRSLSRHRTPVKLRLVQAKGQVYVQLDMKRTPSMSSEATTVVDSEQVVHYEPLKDQPVISVSPAPTRSSFTSESSISQSTVDSTETSPEARGRCRRRSRFKLFGDKRACKASDDSALPASGASSPTLSRSPSPMREQQRERTTCRPKALLTRVASCPGFQCHPRRSNSGSSFSDLPPVPSLPSLSPVPQTPDSARCWLSDRLEKEKEVVRSPPPKPRTQPYAAPYFALPPDSKPGPGVLPPIGERRKTSSSVGTRRQQRVATS